MLSIRFWNFNKNSLVCKVWGLKIRNNVEMQNAGAIVLSGVFSKCLDNQAFVMLVYTPSELLKILDFFYNLGREIYEGENQKKFYKTHKNVWFS